MCLIHATVTPLSRGHEKDCVSWVMVKYAGFGMAFSLPSMEVDTPVRNKHPARRKRHILRNILLLALLAAASYLGWQYLAPLLSDTQVPTYASYTVQRGSIATSKSFSATISVLNSETHQNTSGATAIRELYVEVGQEVREGDKLMLLDNGEIIRAGLDGVVNEMRFDTSDWLWNNVQLIQICDLTNLQVSLSVDEYDVKNVAAGQKCIVTIVPLGLDFETEIAHVDRVSASSGQVAYYTATAELTVPENVLPGMTASVTIPAEEATGVLTLDMAALAFDDEKNPYVLRQDGEGYAQLPVTTGLTDGMKVEILSGLAEGDQVWAVSGTETVTSQFSLTELYKKLAGEKIVINAMDAGNSSRGNRSNMFPADGMTLPEGMELPEGMSFPREAGESSGGQERTRPDRSIATASDMPQDFQRPQNDTDGEMPARRNQERTETQ